MATQSASEKAALARKMQAALYYARKRRLARLKAQQSGG